MKIVKLMGGLGNQMFQYAFGKALEHKFNEEVLFDKAWFEEAKKQIVGNTGRNKDGVCVRQHELYIFPHLQIRYATSQEVENTRKNSLPHLLRKLLKQPKYSNHLIEQNAFRYEPALLSPRKKGYYEGYFQNELYFKDIRAQLMQSFQLPPLKPTDVYNQNFLQKIQAVQNSVFIHVRREDYVKLNWLVTLNYYKNAIKYIQSQIENPTFFVFCAEDPEYIKNQFNVDIKFELIGQENKTRTNFYENMRLMMACKHAILANSTYSWWAAWLTDQKNKIVTAPSPWIDGQSEIICNNWIKIDNR